MKHTATKMLWALCGMAVMLVLAAGITVVSVSAASEGIYIADATPHYRHPKTGIIEDAGGDGSAVLGQSMTESATYRKALVEVDASGNTYVTVRLQLMDNIENLQFQVDSAGNGSFSAVSATLMQEDYINNTADYRMKVPNENAVIRCNMYVTAMGRDVIFYITVSNLQSGSGDFITSIKVEQPTATALPKPTATPKPVQTLSPTLTVQPTKAQTVTSAAKPDSALTQPEAEPTVSGEPTEAAQTRLTETPSAPPEAETPSPTPEGTSGETAGGDGTEEDEKVFGLQEFDSEGNRVTDSSVTNAVEKKESGGNLAGRVIAGLLVVAAVGFCIWYFGFFRKKKQGGRSNEI